MNKNQIITEIKDYVSKRGGSAQDWYTGITEDVEKRLFTGHNVSKENDFWIHREADSSEDAREIEKKLLDLGFDGGPGGGDSGARHVYAYKKNNHTKEE